MTDSKMVPIRIDMDEAWIFWPKLRFEPPEELKLLITEMGDNQELIDHVIKNETPSMQVPEELLDEYDTARKQYWDVIEKLEQLFRIQEGMAPYPERAIPVYKLLNE